MYKCEECERVFDEPEIEHTTYEYYYGVSDLFPDSHSMEIHKCPYCHEENSYFEISEKELERIELEEECQKIPGYKESDEDFGVLYEEFEDGRMTWDEVYEEVQKLCNQKKA